MRARLLLLSIAITAYAACPACSARAQDAVSAKTFVESLYKLYTKDGKGVPSFGPHAGLYYHSSLLALMRADERAVGPGYVGAIEADPVCSCQDWEGIWELHVEVKMQSPNHAMAIVSFAVFEPKAGNSEGLNHLTITLVPENGQWRIWNILDNTDPKEPFDVREALIEEIQQLKKPSSAKAPGTP